MKTFKNEFDQMAERVSSGEPFSFARFSDGELTVLRNKTLILGDGILVQGDIYEGKTLQLPSYAFKKDEEQKRFLPEETPYLHTKLVEAFKHRKSNYFKGIPPYNGQDGPSSWQFCKDLYGEGDEKHLTFSNVLINDNYKHFVSDIVPLFEQKDVVLISNKNSKFDKLPFKVKKHFPVGPNCMKDDYYLIDACKHWIKENNIENHLFLFAAASLSNFLCYELYKDFDKNQYMDIGSALGPYLQLEGWKAMRTYLKTYWANPQNPPPQDVDLWN
tara:strand:+ start:1809 stop:2627 length:819 start_codon:yes stop_codon:yes gene_type:complete